MVQAPWRSRGGSVPVGGRSESLFFGRTHRLLFPLGARLPASDWRGAIEEGGGAFRLPRRPLLSTKIARSFSNLNLCYGKNDDVIKSQCVVESKINISIELKTNKNLFNTSNLKFEYSKIRLKM